jgi:hypothetical protein
MKEPATGSVNPAMSGTGVVSSWLGAMLFCRPQPRAGPEPEHPHCSGLWDLLHQRAVGRPWGSIRESLARRKPGDGDHKLQILTSATADDVHGSP